jgi:hypothetical protein
MRQKAECAEPIVDRDDDRALLREPRTVVSFFAAESGEETAAVDPHEYGTRDAGSGKRERTRPDIEIEAILRDPSGERIDVAVGLVLDAVVAELTCGANTTPAFCRSRRLPPQSADWRCGVRNSAKDHHARSVEAFEGASVDGDPRRRSTMPANEA